MRRPEYAALFLLLAAGSLSTAEPLQVRDDQLPIKEPDYTESPRYALLLLGAEGTSAVWIVEDGTTLYVDQNGNRDLTDDGPPIKATNLREFNGSSGPSWDRDYLLDEIALPDGSRHTNFRLAHWNYNDPEDQYGVKLTLNGQVPMYAGWMPLLKPTAREAFVVHFGRPVAPRKLRFKEFVPGTNLDRLSIAFTNPDSSRLTDARLSILALPESVRPTVLIDWPVPEGAAPLQTAHELTERCCYWEFYTENVPLPARAIPGTATVTVSVPLDQFPLELCSDRFDVTVTQQR